MNCLNCGAEIAQTDRFCQHCGKTNLLYRENPEPSQTPIDPSLYSRKNRKFPVILLIAIIAVSLLVTAVAVVVAVTPKPDDDYNDDYYDDYYDEYGDGFDDDYYDEFDDDFWYEYGFDGENGVTEGSVSASSLI